MTNDTESAILEWVTRFYIESPDFNGIPTRLLRSAFAADVLHGVLADLVDQDFVSIVYGNAHPNPHIRALYDIPKAEQIKLLFSESFENACVYPSAKQLELIVDRGKFEGRPYSLLLALGTPQLDFRAFDLSVLEHYRNDPRYHYETDDIHGSLSVRDEYYLSSAMAERDQVLLKTFGFCYDEAMNRGVAVFVRYLAGLSPEHQQIWKAKELSRNYELHPDYFRATILGDWSIKVSLFAAFLEELQVINRMAHALGRPPLFRQDFAGKPSPVGFSFLVRPTLSEYSRFIHLLDRLLSDNINKEFFRGDVPYEQDEVRGDGKIVVRQKGTLAILEHWMRSRLRTTDCPPIDEALAAMREIRQKRQKPAHAIDDDAFNQTYFHEQRALMIRAYNAVRAVRLALGSLPAAAQVEINDCVRRGEIWTY